MCVSIIIIIDIIAIYIGVKLCQIPLCRGQIGSNSLKSGSNWVELPYIAIYHASKAIGKNCRIYYYYYCLLSALLSLVCSCCSIIYV